MNEQSLHKTKEEKKALKNRWKEAQNKKRILTKTQVKNLFKYLDKQLEIEPCDHSYKHSIEWIKLKVKKASVEEVLEEFRDMGGYCDCEVVANCYEQYEW